MKKIVFILIALIAAFTASAGDFNTLLARFKAGDKSLTKSEISELYYGAATHPSPDLTRINALRAQKDYASMLPLCKDALQQSPTSLTLLVRTIVSAASENDLDLSRQAQWQAQSLCETIFASGKGTSEFDPYIVARHDDIETFMSYYLYDAELLGYSQKGSQTVARVNWPDMGEVYFYFEVL